MHSHIWDCAALLVFLELVFDGYVLLAPSFSPRAELAKICSASLSRILTCTALSVRSQIPQAVAVEASLTSNTAVLLSFSHPALVPFSVRYRRDRENGSS